VKLLAQEERLEEEVVVDELVDVIKDLQLARRSLAKSKGRRTIYWQVKIDELLTEDARLREYIAETISLGGMEWLKE
jgi:hypothetical protein